MKADAAIAPAKIAGGALTRATEFGGALQGRFDQLVLRPGSVSLTELKPGLIEQVIADSDLVLQVKDLKEKSLTAGAALGEGWRAGGQRQQGERQAGEQDASHGGGP